MSPEEATASGNDRKIDDARVDGYGLRLTLSFVSDINAYQRA